MFRLRNAEEAMDPTQTKMVLTTALLSLLLVAQIAVQTGGGLVALP